MLRRLAYPLFGAVILGGYSAAMVADWDPVSNVSRSVLSAEARRTPGAYRAPIFWTGTGFTGGK
ncbi:MAG: hypothetical protein IT379_00395 [Deltaproteobacteria bacterium]|nr:hypothetical protein [Deltaproteobacteria bacterium]